MLCLDELFLRLLGGCQQFLIHMSSVSRH
jgi:hypothetical protein